MSLLIHKYRQFKVGFYKRVFGLNTAENHLLNKTIKRSVKYDREQYFDAASLIAFYSLYGLIDRADANQNPVVSKPPPAHASPKLKPNPATANNAGSESVNPINLLSASGDSKHIIPKDNPNNLINSDFIAVSVLSISELDEILDAKVKVAIPVLTEVVAGQFDSVFIESFLPLTQLVSARLDLSDVVSFSALQDSMPVHQIWISGAVQISATEGGLLVFANALANALASMGVLSVVNLPDTFPAGISYDAATSSFGFNPNDVAYNRLAEGQILSVPVAYKVSDGTVEVDASVIFQITGVNDAPIVTGDFVGQVIEAGGLDNAISGSSSASGQLFSDDVDEGQSNRFQVKASVLSDKAWGWYSVDANGHWTYSLDNSQPDVQALASGMVGSDSFTIKTVDGTEQSIQISITGSDDLASLSSAVISLDETNAVLSTLGVLTISDFDSLETFVAQEATVGAYGVFSLTTAGAWNYTANSAFDNLVAGQQITDRFAVESSDGASTYVTVTITGTNDAASISGTSTAALTESDMALTASGTLTISDVDSEAFFITQTDALGSHGFGRFSINAAGDWTYSAGAHDEFKAGVDYTDSITVASVDGTATQVITVTITGTNDAASISGTSTAALTESDMALTASGTLTISDVDSEAFFITQTDALGSHGFGRFSINAAGQWTYSAGSHNEFKAGVDYTDSITVASADGTATQVITVTITGTNDAAIISGISAAALTENDMALTASGTLTISDVDSEAFFITQTDALGSHGFGRFSINALGQWTYSAGPHNEFKAGVDYTDSITVASVDGAATQVITVTITGTNDPAVISGNVSGDVTEASNAYVIAHNLPNGFDTASGDLNAVDVDNLADGFSVVSQGQLGTLAIASNGVWHYSVNNNNRDVRVLNVGEITTDSVVVQSADGTEKIITITIHGTNEGPVALADTGSALESGVGLGADSGANAEGNVLSNDTDIDTPHSHLVVTAVSNSNHPNGVLGAMLSGQYGQLILNSDGSYVYQIDNTNPSVDQLARGQQLSDVFNYVVSDGEFTDSNSLTITIQGGNDAPVLSVMPSADQGALLEDSLIQVAQGQFTASDVDLNAVYTWSVMQTVGVYGKLTIDQNGQWIYQLNNGDDGDATNPVQALAAGVEAQDYFDVRVEDQHGAYAEHQVAIKITGVNDSALITGDISSQVVADNLSNQASGSLIADDPDTGESGFKHDTLSGVFGTLTIYEFGDWIYSVFSDLSTEQLVAIQQLGEGDSVPDVFTVQSIDGTEQDVTINIFGINDPAELNAILGADITEGSSVPTTGHISIIDPDPGEARFIEQNFTTDYGVFILTANGDWSYTLNLENADIKHLVSGEFLNDYFDAMSFDGSAHTSITITIKGIDDALILDGPSYSLVVTDKDVPQSNTVNTGSDLLQAFNLSNHEEVTDVVASLSFDQQKTTDYGILYLDSAFGLYEFAPNKDAIKALNSKLLLLVDINIINNGNTIPTNIVITLTNSSISNDSFAGVEVTELNFSDLIDLSSLNEQYDIQDVSFKHGPGQDNYLVINDTPVVDVVDLAHLSVLIDGYSYSYDLSI